MASLVTGIAQKPYAGGRSTSGANLRALGAVQNICVRFDFALK